jgi:outer membrane autotransporter protein
MYGATSYYFAVDSAGDKLALNYQGRSIDTSPAKSYLEAPLAALALTSDHDRVSADLASRQIAGSTEQGVGVLLGITGSHNRVKTGSHAEIDGLSVLVGPAWRFDNLSGTSRLGVFFEGGRGEYDAYNRYIGRQVKSSGDVDHAGGMVFGRHDFNDNYYVEASARLGRVNTGYKTHDLGAKASFDSSALYWGLHVGGGYLHTINDQSSVQPYLNVYFTRQNSDDVTTMAKERVRLETADSVTTRLGARYRHAINETITAQVGAAWDQEIDGEQKGTIDGNKIDSPSMKGASAFGEIGISIKPPDAPYFVELNAFGNAGKRDGGGGQASVGFNF